MDTAKEEAKTAAPGKGLKIAELILIAISLSLILYINGMLHSAWLDTESFRETSMSAFQWAQITAILLCIILAIIIISVLIVGYFRKKKTGESLFPKASHFFRDHKYLRKVTVIACILVAFAALLYHIQPIILFYPNTDRSSEYYLKNGVKEPQAFQQLSLDDGKFAGIKYSHEGDTRAVLYFCGNMQTAARFMSFLSSEGHLARAKDTTVVCIDYPGYGHSQGEPEERSINEMTEAASDYVRTLAEPQDITVVGYSIGTGPATYAATLIDPGKLVLVAPYNNMTSLYNTRLNIFYGPIGLLARYRFPSDERLPQLTCPIYIYASSFDRTIPIRLSRALAECNPNAVMCDDVGLEHGIMSTAPVIWEEVFR